MLLKLIRASYKRTESQLGSNGICGEKKEKRKREKISFCHLHPKQHLLNEDMATRR